MVLGLTVEIRGDTKDLDSALGKSKGGVADIGGGIAGTALKILPFAAAATGAALALGAMAKGAAEDAAQQAKLDAAITAATGSQEDHTAAVDAAIAAGQEKAFTDTETRDALQALVTSTGDLGMATDQLALAQDVARFAGVDLATAADAVAKANEGQDGALRKLLPGLEKGATATDTIAAAQKAAAGQADAYASTTEAGFAKAGDAMGELGETVGAALLPALSEIIKALLPVIKQLGLLITAIMPVLTPLIRVLGAVLGIVANALGVVVGWLIKLVTWLQKAIEWVGGLLDKIGPLKTLGGIVGGIVGGLSTATAAAAPLPGGHGAERSGGGGGSASSVTINITATGDSLATEQAVMRALRRNTRLNAGNAPGWAGSG